MQVISKHYLFRYEFIKQKAFQHLLGKWKKKKPHSTSQKTLIFSAVHQAGYASKTSTFSRLTKSFRIIQLQNNSTTTCNPVRVLNNPRRNIVALYSHTAGAKILISLQT
jgi:hypothetical protein